MKKKPMRGGSIPPLAGFLIRNRGVVAEKRIAEFLRVKESAVRRLYASMGFPEVGPTDPEKAFPIIVRVNWDILPEEDIRRLTGVSERRYRKNMQEMDMLDVRMGRQPERFEKIVPGTETINGSLLKDIRKLVRETFDSSGDRWKPFDFLKEFTGKEPGFDGVSRGGSSFNTYMMYTYGASCGDFLLTGEDFYPEGILGRLQNRGVNAGWMPALLKDLAPGGPFREFGDGHEIRIKNLRKQVEKALRHGIRLYLYLNEPRFMPASFFKNHPETRGMRAFQEGYYGMCTSVEVVRDWLRESMRFVFSRIPELGGIILITASEYETNCYSHIATYDFRAGGLADGDAWRFGLKGDDRMCPRCEARGPEAVLSDMAHLAIEARNGTPARPDIIQWLWSWNYIIPADRVLKAIEALPAEVKIMVDWQRGMRFEREGKPAVVDEYTIAYAKPSDYAVAIMRKCKALNRKVLSKCSIATTLEMPALPYMPVLGIVDRLIKELRKYGVDGLLGCWIFGAYPGRNMEMPAVGGVSPLRYIAEKYYGGSSAAAMAAWRSFSRGMKYFPTVQSVLYYSALDVGPGLKFSLVPEPWRSGIMVVPWENVEKVSGTLGAEVMIRSFRKTAGFFATGLKHLEQAVAGSPAEYRRENIRDYGISKACMLHLLSAANYAEFILLRNRLLIRLGDRRLKKSLIGILTDEESNCRAMLALMKRDSRIGYSDAEGYFYTPMEIVEKICSLRETRRQLKGEGTS